MTNHIEVDGWRFFFNGISGNCQHFWNKCLKHVRERYPQLTKNVRNEVIKALHSGLLTPAPTYDITQANPGACLQWSQKWWDRTVERRGARTAGAAASVEGKSTAQQWILGCSQPPCQCFPDSPWQLVLWSSHSLHSKYLLNANWRPSNVA